MTDPTLWIVTGAPLAHHGGDDGEDHALAGGQRDDRWVSPCRAGVPHVEAAPVGVQVTRLSPGVKFRREGDRSNEPDAVR